jgi:hypothetical protein
METRIQQKVDEHLRNFKTQLGNWLISNNAVVSRKEIDDSLNTDITNEFLQFMFDSENIQLQKEDFQRRKRIKNHVPMTDRCCAKRANGEQCTRRRLEGNFCGTHMKGAPHGIIDQEDVTNQPFMEKVEIWMQDIQGISYYIDKVNNVYSPEDIVSNKTNPRIIGKWESSKTSNGDKIYNLIMNK